MIDNMGSLMELVCDNCGDSQGDTFPTQDFDVMIADAKAKGWTILKEGKDWVHYCPSC